MRGISLSFAAALVIGGTLLAAEVQVQTKPSPTKAPASPASSPAKAPTSPTSSPKKAPTSPASSPTKPPPSPAGTPSPAPATQALPQYRPALLGTGPTAVINRIDTAGLITNGQKDATLSFCCSVNKLGEIANVWTYRGSPDSVLLERELVRCLDTALFVPAIYNHELVHVLFFGTVTFKVVNGKPRLRIFANQETEELTKEADFIGPQPFVGPGSKFEGLHYPDDSMTSVLSGIVELAMKVDANGNLKDLKVVSETPPLVGFRRAAAEDFRVASFIPAFRDGKPVECSVTLPVYYEP